MGTNNIYRHPQYPRQGGEVILKEEALRHFYSLRFAVETLRPMFYKTTAAGQAAMTLAGMSGTAVSHAMGDWEARVYDELMDCAHDCATKGLMFEGFEEHLLGDYRFTIAVEVEDDEDDDE